MRYAILLAADGPVVAGVWPAAKRSFTLSWNGVGGDESLRGIVEWQGAGDGNVLADSVVRVSPKQG
jgi:hypothetical protein